MKHLFLWVLLAHIFVVNAQSVKIKSAKVSFEFPSKDVQGSIGGFDSQSVIDWENPSNSTFKGSVAVSTLDTNNGLRNWSLRSSKYFDAKDYPRIYFTSKEIQKMSDLWIVKGDLTMKGITKSFQFTFKESNNTLIGQGELYSSDFDIKIKKSRADNLVRVRIELDLMR